MSDINQLLDEFHQIATDPAGAVARWKKETGKGAIGVLPVSAPEEMVHATGFLPVGIWGGHVEISEARAYLPAFACSIMQSIMEFAIKGVYDDLAAVLISSPCDTLKCFGQKWKGKCPAIQFVQPQNRVLESANVFLAEEYRVVRAKLESATGVVITDEALEKSIRVYNANRAEMRRFTVLARKHPELISPAARHDVIKSRYFMEKGAHTKKVRELNDLLSQQPDKVWPGKKVVLTGITAEPGEMLDMFAKAGFAVVADDLAHESRQFSHDVPEGGSPLYRLAKWWTSLESCSLATDRHKRRIDTLLDTIYSTGADGVIVCMMKFCDPEEFDYPIIYKRLAAAHIPILYLEIDQAADSFEQIRTKIQSFTEML
jgi:benzoyl-CoA reductase/2-hydroxyglutaryl-CoA dehydratase subunit BcrC/BadD/HgdB